MFHTRRCYWFDRLVIGLVGLGGFAGLPERTDSVVRAAKITLSDGRILMGKTALVAGVAEDPNAPARKAGEVDVQPILITDDGLRRTYLPKKHVVGVDEAADDAKERVRLRQSVASKGLSIGGVGPIIEISPFDKYGRRIFSMMTNRGRVDVVQGVTEITPDWTKVEALLGGGKGTKPYVWEMRIATSSIPREILSAMLGHAIDATKVQDRLRVVRMYLQSDAIKTPASSWRKSSTIFQEWTSWKGNFGRLRQLGARTLLREIQMRRDAGQHTLAQAMLAKFPADGVAGETLEHVREILREYAAEKQQIEQVGDRFEQLVQNLEDAPLKDRTVRILTEIGQELRIDTLGRMASFARLADDASLDAEQRIALAISGWLVGANEATENLPVALSLYDVRQGIVDYLREPLHAKRDEILGRLRSQEGAAPRQVGGLLLSHMRPPLESPREEKAAPGSYGLEIPGLDGERNVHYFVQLPHEYDPYRHYPTIVTLNGAGSSPQLQLDWWAGAPDQNGVRQGQATRHGYITIAVDWRKPNQPSYEYSAREHHAILACLRDAIRRFAIDTDRVYLSGHDIGGDAVWDVGLAHPDLWAGVIPIVAVADRYCKHYWENARYVPFYVVAGEKDGDKIQRNALHLDRYLSYHFDTTFVEYRGRGHEHFYDEILRLFDWMPRYQRNFFPSDFDCVTMREWDNYFWWLEITGFPKRSAVDPFRWPAARGIRPLEVKGGLKKTNAVSVKAGSSHVSVWLAPELVDFDKPISVRVNGRAIGKNAPIRPDLALMLEDVRTRGDRQHPFWAKVEK